MTSRPDLARVVVVGTSCSGKTTFGQRLASLVGSPFIELDSLYWGPAWTPRTDFQTGVHAVVEQSRWVIDGNYSAVRDVVWRRATAIVWLDYSFVRVFSQAIRRTARRIVTGERLYAGNRETIRNALFERDGIPWWVIRTHARRRREYPELLRRPEYAQATVIRLDRPATAETFLSETQRHSAPAGGSQCPG